MGAKFSSDMRNSLPDKAEGKKEQVGQNASESSGDQKACQQENCSCDPCKCDPCECQDKKDDVYEDSKQEIKTEGEVEKVGVNGHCIECSKCKCTPCTCATFFEAPESQKQDGGETGEVKKQINEEQKEEKEVELKKTADCKCNLCLCNPCQCGPNDESCPLPQCLCKPCLNKECSCGTDKACGGPVDPDAPQYRHDADIPCNCAICHCLPCVCGQDAALEGERRGELLAQEQQS